LQGSEESRPGSGGEWPGGPGTLVRKAKMLATEVGGIGKLKAMIEALQE
jgi:hypothetical protein